MKITFLKFLIQLILFFIIEQILFYYLKISNKKSDISWGIFVNYFNIFFVSISFISYLIMYIINHSLLNNKFTLYFIAIEFLLMFFICIHSIRVYPFRVSYLLLVFLASSFISKKLLKY
jgi:hypothetical protein